VTSARTRDGEVVLLEKWTETEGDRRYRVVEPTSPPVVELVSPASTFDAYPDHRKDCPAHGNGLV
jgi:hypothetical protein